MADSNKSTILKWTTGILASVISGLILWNFTNEDGLFKKKKEVVIELKKPILKITAFDSKQFFIVENMFFNSTDGNVTVYNSGNDVATNCKILWECPPNTINMINMNQPGEFSLLAGESRTFKISSPYLNRSGYYDCTIIVSATNSLPDTITKRIQVIKDFINDPDSVLIVHPDSIR